jgi:hypothetical protein
MQEILRRVRKHHEANPVRKEQERLRAKIGGITSQLDGIGERIVELPKSVSAAPLYKQMERLEGLKKEHEAALLTLAMTGQTARDRIVGLESFQDFAGLYRKFLAKEATVPERKQTVQKFIRKFEVGKETVKIHFIVDQEHYRRELASKEAGTRPFGASSDLFSSVGSNTLTFGARKRT